MVVVSRSGGRRAWFVSARIAVEISGRDAVGHWWRGRVLKAGLGVLGLSLGYG
jgi:hypothetical protein